MPAPAGNQYALNNMGGRPSKYIAEYAEQARKLCELGATDAELASFFKVNMTTIYEWSSKHPEFSKAIKVGKGGPDDLIERSLFMRARGFWVNTEKIYFTPGKANGSVPSAKNSEGELVEVTETQGQVTRVETREYYPPDTTAAYHWLKCRRPGEWREQHNVNLNGTVNVKHTLRDLTNSAEDEVQREYAEALGAAPQMQLLPPPKER